MRIVRSIFWICCFLTSAIFLLLVTYFFGHQLLTGGLIGNDTPNSFSLISWLNAQYPHIPLWYPLQGAGISTVQGYQVAPHLFVVWLHRFSSLSLIQSFELVSFLSVFISALGVYIAGWYLTKKQMVAFLAGFFYLLSPLSWVWIAQAGFFAQSLSFVFFPLAFIAIDAFVFSWSKRESGKKVYGFFLLSIFFLGLSLLGHFSTYMSVFNLFFIYAIVLLVYDLFRKKTVHIKSFFLGFPAVFASGVFLVAFWFFSLYYYISAANWDGSNNVDPSAFPVIDGHAFLSLPSPTYAAISVWNLSIPLWMWILSACAAVFTFRKHRKIFALSIVFLISLYGSISYEIFILSAKISAFFASGFSPRVFWVVAQFLAPLLAAIVLWLFVEWIFALLRNRKGMFTNFLTRYIPILTLALAIIIVILFRSPDSGISSFAHYGPIALYPRMGMEVHAPSIQGGLDLRDVWQKTFTTCSTTNANGSNGCFLIQGNAQGCGYRLTRSAALYCEQHGYVASIPGFFAQLSPYNWPPLVLGNPPPTESIADVNQIAKAIPYQGPLTRIDISPHLGTVVEAFNIVRQDLSQVNVYTFQLSLLHEFWAMEQGAFYGANNDGINTTVALNREMGEWFGTNFVVLGVGDPVDRFLQAGIWKIFQQTKQYTIMQLKHPVGLAEVSNKPKVLVIGQWSKRAYEEVFRVATNGMLPENKGLLVMGKSSIEDYSEEQLSQFPLIIMQGYTYTNQQHAWNVLSTYIANGGKVFIDTGWQYVVPDAVVSHTPDFFPTTSLSWVNLPTSDWYVSHNPTFASSAAVSKFAPLTYSGSSWGVSTSQSLKSGAVPLLSYDNYPLIAKMTYGNGEIIWSGMNLFSHALDKINTAEIGFIGRLISSLLPQTPVTTYPFTFSIPTVDSRKLIFTHDMQQGSVLLREAYIANWQATLITPQGSMTIPIYRAGPGLMLVPLNTIHAGDVLIFSYQLVWFEWFGILLSILFVLFLFLLAFDIYGNHMQLITGLFAHVNGIHMLRRHVNLQKYILGDEDD